MKRFQSTVTLRVQLLSNSSMSDFRTAVEALVGLMQTEVELYMLKEQLHEALQALQSQCSELQVQLSCEEQTCAQQEVAKTLELADSSLGSAMQEEQHVHQQLQEVVLCDLETKCDPTPGKDVCWISDLVYKDQVRFVYRYCENKFVVCCNFY